MDKAANVLDFDTHIYGPGKKYEGYNAFIPIDDEAEEQRTQGHSRCRDLVKKVSSYTAPKHLISELQNFHGKADEEGDNNNQINKAFGKRERIIDRENDYRRRRLNRKLSPPRHDPFAAGDRSPSADVSTYADVMREHALIRLEHETHRLISQKRKHDGSDVRERHPDAKFERDESKSRGILDSKEIKYSQEKRKTQSSRRRHKRPHSSKDKRS